MLVVAAVAVLLGTAILADDFEDPVEPPIGGLSYQIGDTEVEAEDVWGPGIDVKEALEPQMTVLMMMEEQSLSAGMVTVVRTLPTFESWAAER